MIDLVYEIGSQLLGALYRLDDPLNDLVEFLIGQLADATFDQSFVCREQLQRAGVARSSKLPVRNIGSRINFDSIRVVALARELTQDKVTASRNSCDKSGPQLRSAQVRERERHDD